MLSKEWLQGCKMMADAGVMFQSDAVKSLLDHIADLQKNASAMARICAGMTLEEMQNAPFTYKALLEIVQRRDVRESLTARPEGV